MTEQRIGKALAVVGVAIFVIVTLISFLCR